MGDKSDLSSLFEMLNDKGIDINGLMQNFSNTNNSNNNNNNNNNNIENDNSNINASFNKNSGSVNPQGDNNFQMPDMETMMKIMKIMNSMNSNVSNPSANLLYSLKPFLRDSKKEKIDQYIKFLKMSSIISEINKSGGDLK